VGRSSKGKVENLIPFQKGFDPRRNITGANRKVISAFIELGYKPKEIRDTYVILMAMTEAELQLICDNKECSVLERTVALSLLKGMQKGSLYNIETVISRAIGTPNQTADVTIDNKIEVVFVKGKTIL
jgi:glycerol-3-phosphate dehydrogenase